MKAVVVSKANTSWELQDMDLPGVEPHQVLMRLHVFGICGTDLWMAWALTYREFPLALGHKGADEIVSLDEGLTKRKTAIASGSRPFLPGRATIARQ